MSSTAQRFCTDCGAVLPEASSSSTCTRCLLKACFESASESGPQETTALPSDLAAPGEVFGDYELLEEIARGGMGVVFKARQRSLDRIVAVKMMLPGWLNSRESVRRFRIEAEAASRLRHPGIVAIHEVGECQGQHFYSMDFIAGQNLVRRVKEQPVSPEHAAHWTRLLAEAIHHAHQHGILHRDLKPANVLIDDQDQPHVTDFGLAKLLDDERDLTVPGRVLGTPSFMPPEQADPRLGLATVASDVYGLGAILYFLLTGRAPVQGDSTEHTLRRLLTEEPVPPSRVRAGIGRDLETICLKCLQKDPSRRYSSAHDLANDLAAWGRHEPIQARPVTSVERSWFWARRNPGLAMVSAGLVASLIVGAIVQQMLLNSARRERAAAEKAKATAEGLVQYMNEDLTDQLRPLGRLRLLDNVNRTVQRYYQGLPMNETSSEPAAGKAHFFQNNAAVLRELGRLDEAAQSARSAIELLETLDKRAPNQPELAAALAGAHSELRNCIATVDETKANEHALKSVQFYQRAHDLNPASETYSAKLANARLELVSVLQQQHKPVEADREIRLARELLSGLQANAANTWEIRELLAQSCYHEGVISYDQGHGDESKKHFDEYLQRTEKLAQEAADPTDARALQSLAIAHSHVGRALFDRNEVPMALEHFRKYYQFAADLQRLDPGNVNYRRELGFSLGWLAEALAKSRGASDEIVGYLTSAHECFQKLATDFPQGDIWQVQAGLAMLRLAEWFQNHQMPERGRKLREDEVQRQWNRLLQFGQDRSCHESFLRALSWCEVAGGPPGTLENDRPARLRDWLAKADREAAQPNASREWTWTRAILHNRIASAFADQGQFIPARRELEAGLPLWQRLVTDLPDDSGAVAGQAQALGGIGLAALHTDKMPGAAPAIRPFVDWVRGRTNSAVGAPEVLEKSSDLRKALVAASKSPGVQDPGLLKELDEAMDSLKKRVPAHLAAAP